jgi:tRNA-specific 2-thiouridylase
MKIVVAMSGGVDSSVAAALLQKQGHRVIGVTLQIWSEYTCDYSVERAKSCCSPVQIDLARRVCGALRIPHYVFNVVREFEREVVDYFCDEYRDGHTPNPCVICNDRLKFAWLWDRARELGAEAVATGHYAKIVKNGKQYLFKKAADRKKDQSYFLFTLTQEQLKRTLFPLGDYTKDKIRRIAADLGLVTADKAESQDICFIPDNDYPKFLASRLSPSNGPIYNMQGERVGTHKGIPFYTVGQRKRLNLALGSPRYVVRIDAENNALIIGEKKDLLKHEMTAKGVNWINGGSPDSSFGAGVRIRYRHKEAPARILPLGKDRMQVRFNFPQSAITPGQAAVVYNGDTLLGGGWIE